MSGVLDEFFRKIMVLLDQYKMEIGLTTLASGCLVGLGVVMKKTGWAYKICHGILGCFFVTVEEIEELRREGEDQRKRLDEIKKDQQQIRKDNEQHWKDLSYLKKSSDLQFKQLALIGQSQKMLEFKMMVQIPALEELMRIRHLKFFGHTEYTITKSEKYTDENGDEVEEIIEQTIPIDDAIKFAEEQLEIYNKGLSFYEELHYVRSVIVEMWRRIYCPMGMIEYGGCGESAITIDPLSL
jgi:hypothetical protein